MIGIFFENPLVGLLIAIGLVAAITIHEFAHAFVADKLGDPTPRLQDRVTLDPRKHLDPIGTLMILFVGFGWGRAVEFDPYNLRSPRRDTALIALAGPASNIITALILAAILQLTSLPTLLSLPILFTMQISVMLAIFNMIPIHPLDGGKILVGLLPEHIAEDLDRTMHQFGVWILLLLILPIGGQSAVSLLISPIIQFVMSLLT